MSPPSPLGPRAEKGTNRGIDEVGTIRRWAETTAPDAFAGLWLSEPIEDSNAEVITLAFMEDTSTYRDEAHARFGKDLVVVDAEHSLAELNALADKVSQDSQTQEGRSSQQEQHPEPGSTYFVAVAQDLNRVQVGVIDSDSAELAELSDRYGTDRLCLHRVQPAEPPDLEGTVRPLAKAQSWRDGLKRADDSFARLEIAYDRATAERAWAANVPDDLPHNPNGAPQPGIFTRFDDIDFQHEVLVVWSSGQSGSCPTWLADLRTAGDGSVKVQESHSGGPVCTEDYNPYRMVLAVNRGRLPARSALPADISGVPSGRVVRYP